MVTIHHLEQSRSTRVIWLAEEMGLPYRLDVIKRDPETFRAPRSMADLDGLGKAPIITDESAPGGPVSLGESAAILDYLTTRHGGEAFRVAHDEPGYPEFVFFLHYAEGSLGMPVVSLMIHKVLMGGQGDEITLLKFFEADAKRHMAFIEARLGDGRHFIAGGRFTIADIMLGTMLDYARRVGLTEDHAHLTAYLGRLETRPAFQKAQTFG